MKVRAAEALERMAPEDESHTSWQRSVQVRPDYVPPSPLDAVRIWYEAGTITDDDFRALMDGAR